jgi:hypothetical protein
MNIKAYNDNKVKKIPVAHITIEDAELFQRLFTYGIKYSDLFQTNLLIG